MTPETKLHPDCPQLCGICRSPYLCSRFGKCFDLVTPQEELKLLACEGQNGRAPRIAKDAA